MFFLEANYSHLGAEYPRSNGDLASFQWFRRILYCCKRYSQYFGLIFWVRGARAAKNSMYVLLDHYILWWLFPYSCQSIHFYRSTIYLHQLVYDTRLWWINRNRRPWEHRGMVFGLPSFSQQWTTIPKLLEARFEASNIFSSSLHTDMSPTYVQYILGLSQSNGREDYSACGINARANKTPNDGPIATQSACK